MAKFIALVVWVLTACLGLSGIANAQSVPVNFCDKGVFVIGSRIMPFEDIVIDKDSFLGVEADAYGYISEVSIEVDSLLPGVRATLFGDFYNDECSPTLAMPKDNYDVTLFFREKDYSGNSWKELKRILLQASDGVRAKALVKVSGKFTTYANSSDLYFQGSRLEVLEFQP